MTLSWREYHDSTKHSGESLRRTAHFLDWANAPDPFRHYQGVPVLDLPAETLGQEAPALQILPGSAGNDLPGGSAFLSRLLFHSAAISASKRVPKSGDRYALRVNPSSGNLHPTEFHFITHRLLDWPDGVYHYRPSSHMAEQRGAGDFRLPSLNAPITFLLSTIAWREAWKYRSRAYRYCLLDIGHAWQALASAAQAMGCDTFATGQFSDDEAAEGCVLNADEWPMLMVALKGDAIPIRTGDGTARVWFGGQPNQISRQTIDYSLINEVHAATKLNLARKVDPAPAGSGEIHLPPAAQSARTFGETVRGRRSALDFIGGARTISLPQLSALLEGSAQPFCADFAATRFIQLYLYVHRVDGLDPGVYRFWPERSELELVRSGDQRVAAAGLSLGQDLAGNACVAFSMIGDLERATRAYGDRGYRYVHFEAGAMGHRLYLAAEALGLGATGIGAFFDDEVHGYLHLTPADGQVVYHFAIGYPVADSRLSA